MEYKTLIDDYFRRVPEYYPEMYQDGFTPEEIMYAFRKQMRRQAENERPENQFQQRGENQTMRIDNSSNRRRKKEKQRREQSIMEKEIFRFVE